MKLVQGILQLIYMCVEFLHGFIHVILQSYYFFGHMCIRLFTVALTPISRVAALFGSSGVVTATISGVTGAVSAVGMLADMS